MADEKLQQEANDRLIECRRMKIQFELDIREGYFFAAPHRARNVLSTVPTSEVKPKDFAQLNQSFAFELTEDFTTVIMNTFLPESEHWAKREAGMHVPLAQVEIVNKAARAGDDQIFKAIASSNFYPACGLGFTPDLALGTVGMWIDRNQAGRPINCQPIPIRELEINLGPFGGIDDRFVSRWTRNCHIKALTKGITLPEKMQREIDNSPRAKTNISWGFWRDWEQEDNETWQYVVLIGNELVDSKKIKGIGCCPLIVARFSPSPEWSWGVGPLIKSLPDLRTEDALAEAKIKNLELGLRPPIAWPDDSWTNIESGIECDMAYPVRPGSEGAIKAIYTPNPPDAAIYDRNDLEQRLRRLFFLDWPKQTGDTPPTATQWLDEMTMAQRRIGTPGLVFWSEFCGGVFSRYQYILEKEGVIQPIKIDGKAASLQPFNPAQRAAEQQEVAEFTRFVQIAGAASPEEFKMWTDGLKTMLNLRKKIPGGGIWVQRTQEQVQAAVDQIQKLQQGTAPTAPAQAGAPPVEQPAGPAPVPAALQIRGRM